MRERERAAYDASSLPCQPFANARSNAHGRHSQWIAQFGVGGVQVVYTHDLQRDPERVLKAIERHIGIGQFTKYSNVNTTMNAEGKYGWVRKDNEASHDDPRSKMSKPTYEKLLKFYAPSMVELQRMAQKGLISELPSAWVQEWRL